MVFMQHLLGRKMPNVELEATSGAAVNPARLQGPAGQNIQLQSPNGHKIQIGCLDNPDGSHSFQTVDLG